MPKADAAPTISRRAALSLGVSALAVPASASASDADANLVGLCERYVARGKEIRRLDIQSHETGRRGISDDDYTDLNIAADDALDAVLDTPARTLRGVRAKAEALEVALMLEIDIDWLCPFEERADPHDLLARSLAEDIARLIA